VVDIRGMYFLEHKQTCNVAYLARFFKVSNLGP
jgi:hypothetical protein